MKALSIISRALVLLAVLLVAAPQIAAANENPADKALQEAVSEKLLQANTYDATDIIIVAKDGVIELRGEVKTPGEAERMKEAVETVPGVKYVDSNLTVPAGN